MAKYPEEKSSSTATAVDIYLDAPPTTTTKGLTLLFHPPSPKVHPLAYSNAYDTGFTTYQL
jgi:hypothetical protein